MSTLREPCKGGRRRQGGCDGLPIRPARFAWRRVNALHGQACKDSQAELGPKGLRSLGLLLLHCPTLGKVDSSFRIAEKRAPRVGKRFRAATSSYARMACAEPVERAASWVRCLHTTCNEGLDDLHALLCWKYAVAWGGRSVNAVGQRRLRPESGRRRMRREPEVRRHGGPLTN